MGDDKLRFPGKCHGSPRIPGDEGNATSPRTVASQYHRATVWLAFCKRGRGSCLRDIIVHRERSQHRTVDSRARDHFYNYQPHLLLLLRVKSILKWCRYAFGFGYLLEGSWNSAEIIAEDHGDVLSFGHPWNFIAVALELQYIATGHFGAFYATRLSG